MAFKQGSVKGKLYIGATPIGNLQDVSERFAETAKTVDLILCEDTRHSKKLMNFISCSTPLKPCHQHNEKSMAMYALTKLNQGKKLLLISDAGTPCIQDPGYELVNLCHQHGVEVCVLPGACAVVSAIALSGFNCQSFSFFGYPSSKKTIAKKQILMNAYFKYLQVYYLTPHKLLDQLTLFADIFSAQQGAALIKEISKINEKVVRGTFLELKQWLEVDSQRQKGEFVLVIEKQKPLRPVSENSLEEEFIPSELTESIMVELCKELPIKSAARICSKISEQSRQEIYRFYSNN